MSSLLASSAAATSVPSRVTGNTGSSKPWLFRSSLVVAGVLVLLVVVTVGRLFLSSTENGAPGEDTVAMESEGLNASTAHDVEDIAEGDDARTPTQADESDDAAPETQTGEEQQQERHIIRRARISVRVEEYEPAYTKLTRLAEETGGYISDARTRHHAQKTSQANITLRIPTAHFDATLSSVRGLGEVREESISSEDITRRYVDTQARIRNAQRLESRLVEMLESHEGTLTDLMRVEGEVASVRERIERKQAQIRTWSRLTSLTTIKVTLRIVSPYEPEQTVKEPEQERPSFGAKASDTWSRSLKLLTAIGEGIALGFVAIIPWLPLAALLGVVGFGAARRRRRMQPAEPTPDAPPSETEGQS